ncbi:MAG: efflux RND transporter periplasmic adaptor subunit [Prolixibacteraceae bacterium]|nr:efflux RND transporter periplasmic adaptor subunit [Prolixibacteraceae bacterium]
MSVSKIFKYSLYQFVFFSLLVASCNNNTKSSIALYTVSRDSYIDDIMLEGTVKAVNSATVVCPQMLEGTITFIIEDGTPVKKGDTVCIIENREYANIYQNFVDRVEQSKAQYKKGEADLELNYSLLQAQVKNNEAQTEILFLDSAQLSFLTEQQRKKKELELKIAALEKQKIETKLHFLELINESELKKLELQIQQDEFQLAHVKEILDQMVMTAPVDGLGLRSVSRRSREKVQEGELVWEGFSLVEIPDLNKVEVLIMASESHYKRVKENDQVVYSFDAKTGNTGWGKILKKAPTGEPVNRNSKVKLFEITASVDSFKALPGIGMSAQCRVLLTNVPDTVVIPQLAIFEEDSMKFVYVQQKHNNFVKRQVATGSSSPRSAVIAAGLGEGETVSFVKPEKSKIRSVVFLPDSILIKYKTLSDENDLVADQEEINENNAEYDPILNFN